MRQLTRGELISRGRRRARRARKLGLFVKKALIVIVIVGTIVSVLNGLGEDLNNTINKIHAEPVVKTEPKMLTDYKDELVVKLQRGKVSEDQIRIRLARVDWTWEYAGERGMQPNDRVHMLRVIGCESSWDNEADHMNYHPQKDGTTLASMDRGIAMHNDYWHPEVSNTCAYDWQCAINEMISIAQNDQNFHQWACNDLVK